MKLVCTEHQLCYVTPIGQYESLILKYFDIFQWIFCLPKQYNNIKNIFGHNLKYYLLYIYPRFFIFLALCLPMDSIYYSYLLCYSTGSIEIHRFLPNMLIKVSYKFEYKKRVSKCIDVI